MTAAPKGRRDALKKMFSAAASSTMRFGINKLKCDDDLAHSAAAASESKEFSSSLTSRIHINIYKGLVHHVLQRHTTHAKE